MSDALQRAQAAVNNRRLLTTLFLKDMKAISLFATMANEMLADIVASCEQAVTTNAAINPESLLAYIQDNRTHFQTQIEGHPHDRVKKEETQS